MDALIEKIIGDSPSYQSYLKTLGIDHSRILSISELPIMTKRALRQFACIVPPHMAKSIIPSSGSSEVGFSFGLFGQDEIIERLGRIENFLINRFDTLNRKTLILNLLPGAIGINSESCTVVSIGVRIDTALAAIESFRSYFDQLLLVAEPLLLKALVETGSEAGIDFKGLPVRAITGGDWISETYKDYIESIIGGNRLSTSMGMAELGLNYFFDDDDTAHLRYLVLNNPDLKRSILGGCGFTPMLFSYGPEVFIETVIESDYTHPSLLVTALDSNRIMPLIRYRTGDSGYLLDRAWINVALKSCGMNFAVKPEGPPILAHMGRSAMSQGVSVENVKELLYSDHVLAGSITGQFKLESGTNRLRIQLVKGVEATGHVAGICARVFSCLNIETRPVSYDRYPEPVDYERKVQYI